MSINQLIFRNLKKNIKNYYLYVFALIFSVALYFAFVTLQYDPSMDEGKGRLKVPLQFEQLPYYLSRLFRSFCSMPIICLLNDAVRKLGYFN